MLFNSLAFIVIFLPFLLFFYFIVERYLDNKYLLYLLLSFSIIFYYFWSPKFLIFLLIIVMINYHITNFILRKKNLPINLITTILVLLNLFILIFFKYTGFVLSNFNLHNFNLFSFNQEYFENIILPLGISFYTFQQISYIIDCRTFKVGHVSFKQYALFVLFFPQLIAGPIVHHSDMIPQYQKKLSKITLDNFIIGIAIFSIGLGKKVLIADNLAIFSSPLFSLANEGVKLSFFEAWTGLSAYTAQIYYDFSGYCDMGIGLCVFFGIKLPLNFYSPYKSPNIADFWRKWHITLGRFFKNYIYKPIKIYLSRKFYNKKITLLISLLITVNFTFFISGIWHGSSWNFILWGVYHGLLVSIYTINSKFNFIKINNFLSISITLFLVTLGWGMFNIQSISSLFIFYQSIFSFNEIYLYILDNNYNTQPNLIGSINMKIGLIFTFISFLFILILPNNSQIFNKYNLYVNNFNVKIINNKFDRLFYFKKSILWSLFLSVVFAFSLMALNQGPKQFIYFVF